MRKLKSAIGLKVVVLAALLGGCAQTATEANLPTGDAAYSAISAKTIAPPTAYLVSPEDTLSIRVFGEPELSSDEVVVDRFGNMQMPLVGQIKASGRTAPEIGSVIASQLGRSYLINPQVSVAVVEPAPQYVTVEGDVKEPGVYEFAGEFTLLGAMARAKSPNPTAKIDQIIIFRTIDGQKMAGRFNLADIRGGAAPDPLIMNDDVIMVGQSGRRTAWQDFLKAAPLLNVFTLAATR